MNVELTAKSRLVQTFKFLKELNELRNPVPRDISTYATGNAVGFVAYTSVHNGSARRSSGRGGHRNGRGGNGAARSDPAQCR